MSLLQHADTHVTHQAGCHFFLCTIIFVQRPSMLSKVPINNIITFIFIFLEYFENKDNFVGILSSLVRLVLEYNHINILSEDFYSYPTK